MLISILDKNHLSYLQKECVKKLSNYFDSSIITNYYFEDYFYKGTFGKYQDKDIYVIVLKFQYYDYNFEFIISYNQLEYLILKEKNIIYECNLEDFWEDDLLIKKFCRFLETDLENINLK